MSDIRERLAVELMGWRIITSCTGRKIHYGVNRRPHPVTGEDIYDRKMFSDWQPDQDLNQARLCLLKLGEMDECEGVAHRRNAFINFIDESFGEDPDVAWYAIGVFRFMTLPPEQICTAIISVLDQKGSDPQ